MQSFDDRLAALVASTGGMVPVGEIGRIVAALLESWDEGQVAAAPLAPQPAPPQPAPPLPPEPPQTRGGEADTARELESLLAIIHQTQTEIAAIRPAEIAREKIPHANDQLRSVVDATERATGEFLDIAEELEALATTFGGAGADEIHAITTRMYEASNFQDITGQRISKVTETLRVIEERLTRLVEATGGLVHHAHTIDESIPDPEGEEHLLNGPQLPDAAASQDDIDRLFASI